MLVRHIAELGRVISLIDARPLDYNSRLIVDSVGLPAMDHLKFDFPFLAKSTVSFAADTKLYSTVVRFVQKRKFAAALE